MDQSTNPAKLPWPTDSTGMTGHLKREGCRAIGRMGGDDANLEVVMEVLRILAKHAKAKLLEQKAEQLRAVSQLAVDTATQAIANERAANRQEDALIAQMDTAQAKLDALRDRRADTQKKWDAVVARRAAGEVVDVASENRAATGTGEPTHG